MSQRIVSFFTDSGVPKTGLSPVIIIRDLTNGTVEVNEEAMTEIGDGFYEYEFADYDISIDYAFRADGTSTLDDADRYVYGGNENYVDDIWDASISDHQVVGSMASEIRASHGSALGGSSGGSTLTKEQAEFIAEQVWKVILKNNETAQDVLLSKSDFNQLKDKVMLKDKIPSPADYSGILSSQESLADLVSGISKQLNLVASSLDKVSKDTSIKTAVDGIIEKVGTFNDLVGKISTSSDKVKDQVQVMNDNLGAVGNKEFVDSMKELKDTSVSLLSALDKMKNINPQMKALRLVLLQMSKIKFHLKENRLIKK